MAFKPVVSWRFRLLCGFAALVATFCLSLALTVIRDFWRDPGLTWGNGGEIQIVGYALIVGGLALLATYLLFVLPLVLIWPVSSQLKHWYWMVGASLLWPVLFVDGLIQHESPSAFLRAFRHTPGLYGEGALFAACACCCYLLLLRWERNRQAKGGAIEVPADVDELGR